MYNPEPPHKQTTNEMPLTQLANLTKQIALQPGNANLWSRIGFIFLQLGEHQEALSNFRAAQQIDKILADPWFGEAVALFELGEQQAALELIGQAINRAPKDQRFWSARAHILSALGTAPAQVVDAYKDWAKRFAEPITNALSQKKTARPTRSRFRIGYLSGDFRQHALSYFFLPVLEHHDRQKFELFGFFSGQADTKTSQFEQHFEHWHTITSLSDADASTLIAAQDLDILIDLSGHTDGNRLLALARQPARQQITWYGYNCTTGMGAMQHRLTDNTMDPPGNEAWSTETLLRLPSFACYQPPAGTPTIAPLPALHNGFITFGSLNNPQKLTAETLQIWATILNALPNSRLRLIAPYGPTSASSAATLYHQHLAKHGLPVAQIDLLPRLSLDAFMAQGAEIDIALEPFPFSGGVSTCHTLWMGIPAITLTGTLPFSRAAAAVLQAADLPELIADTAGDYVNKAISLAKDPYQLARLRDNMRKKLGDSILLNYDAQTKALEAHYTRLAMLAQ